MRIPTPAVSSYFTKHLHDLEPREIAPLFDERNAMLAETKDPILVIVTAQHILFANIETPKIAPNCTNYEENLTGTKLSALVF